SRGLLVKALIFPCSSLLALELEFSLSIVFKVSASKGSFVVTQYLIKGSVSVGTNVIEPSIFSTSRSTVS
ncbi:MAG: hypothetical protein ACI9F2_001036, partial [Lysobacterales bacterium]